MADNINRIIIIKLSVFIIFYVNEINSLTCEERDSCQGKVIPYPTEFGKNFTDRNCFCDERCAIYEDCCEDAPIKKPLAQQPDDYPYECLPSEKKGRVYVKVRCNKDWKNDRIKTLCESRNSTDPLNFLPVINIESGMVYRNLHCAICSGEDGKNLESWQTRIECGFSLLLNSSNNFTYSNQEIEDMLSQAKIEHGNSWIIKLRIKLVNKTLTHACYFHNLALKEQIDKMRMCKTHYIPTCPDTWTDKTIAKKCRSVTAFRYHGLTTFKNLYCAQCYNLTPIHMSCMYLMGFSTSTFTEFSSMSLVIKYNFGNAEGQSLLSQECLDGELYDTSEKKCKKIGCKAKITGFEIICKFLF